nr:hypothetical protein Iba_chr13fCG8900 [Ipomoea batatas]
MADRHTSHQARLKSRASTADKGKALASALVDPDPTLVALRPQVHLTIGLEAAMDMERKIAEGLALEKSSAREDALVEYKESEAFREEGAKDTERVTSLGEDGTEIPMDSAYMNSDANVVALA